MAVNYPTHPSSMHNLEVNLPVGISAAVHRLPRDQTEQQHNDGMV